MNCGKVVNCKVSCIRPQYKNLKEWMHDPSNVYIARAGIVFVDKERFPKQSSPFANPYKVNKDGTREEVIEKYRAYILDKLNKDPTLVEALKELKGKNLGCWCAPEPCHGHVLLDILIKMKLN